MIPTSRGSRRRCSGQHTPLRATEYSTEYSTEYTAQNTQHRIQHSVGITKRTVLDLQSSSDVRAAGKLRRRYVLQSEQKKDRHCNAGVNSHNYVLPVLCVLCVLCVQYCVCSSVLP